ncbi:hypothetical protein SF23_00075 [Streptomyces sp. MBRL 10]|nr:hypothetical protein SF23_00075 [Streptomyces sp. MBRL 10]
MYDAHLSQDRVSVDGTLEKPFGGVILVQIEPEADSQQTGSLGVDIQPLLRYVQRAMVRQPRASGQFDREAPRTCAYAEDWYVADLGQLSFLIETRESPKRCQVFRIARYDRAGMCAQPVHHRVVAHEQSIRK